MAEREPHAGEPACGAAHHPLLGRCTLPDHHEGPHVGGSGQYWHEPKFRPLMHRVVELESTVARLEAERDRLREALTSMLNHYVRLAGSGDCGFWDPEEEAEVIAARAALTGA